MGRHKDALDIQQGGACNLIALSRVLVRAIDEVRAEGGGSVAINTDPAVRLIIHQIAFLAQIGDANFTDYDRCMTACEEVANAAERIPTDPARQSG